MSPSALITFATLFIGLIRGPMTVEVVVSPPVTAVRVSLDGEVIAELEDPPWIFDIDFGRAVPHRLDAVGLDASGVEVGRTTQWINLPRAPTELEIALLRGQDGGVQAARLIWALVRPLEPREFRVSLDGRPVPVSDPARVELPATDDDQIHFLRASVDFDEGVIAANEVAYGGSMRGAMGRELTAVPFWLARGADPPTPESLKGVLHVSEKPLDVVAVERPTARVVLVVDTRAVEALLRIGTPSLGEAEPVVLSPSEAYWERRCLAGPRQGEDEVDVLDTSPSYTRRSGDYLARTFTSHECDDIDLGDIDVVLVRSIHQDIEPDEQLLSTATAIAGIAAANGSRRRAVVLVLGDADLPAPDISVGEMRAFLRAIRTPLLVWSPDPAVVAGGGLWGPIEDISTLMKLAATCRALRNRLRGQFIVWVDGTHLPQDITMAGEVPGLSLVE
ncbi:MAG: hypothetical protein GY906_12115 [bacterium]|nr:hypothetical protein [bacterium]